MAQILLVNTNIKTCTKGGACVLEKRAIQMAENDNVATMLCDAKAGEEVTVYDENHHQVRIMRAKDNIPYGNKIALYDIKKGEKGIAIFQPGTSYQRRDGSIGINYNVKHIFDITQTSADEIPSPVEYDRSQLAYAFSHKEKDTNNQTETGLTPDEQLLKLLDHSCHKEGRNLKEPYILSAEYTICQKYHLKCDENFANDCVVSLSQMDKTGRKNTLKSVKRLFDTINTRIEHGLYVYDQEVNGNA